MEVIWAPSSTDQNTAEAIMETKTYHLQKYVFLLKVLVWPGLIVGSGGSRADVYSIGFFQLDACWRGEMFTKYILEHSFRRIWACELRQIPSIYVLRNTYQHWKDARWRAGKSHNNHSNMHSWCFAMEQFSLEEQNKKNQRLSDSLVCVGGRRILSMLDHVLTVCL